MNNGRDKFKNNSHGFFEKYVVLLDSEGRIKSANESSQELLSYSEEELIGRKWCDEFIPEAFRDELKEIHQKILGDSNTEEAHHKHPVVTGEGEKREIFWHKSSLSTSKKKSPAAAFTGIDVTEPRTVIDEVAQLEKDYLSLFHGIKDAVFIQNTSGKFLAVNKEATRRLGYSEKELIGSSPKKIDSFDNQDEVQGRINRILEEGELRFETVHLSKQGEEIPVEVSASLSRFRGDDVILSVARDIRERKKAYQKLKKRQQENSILLSNLPGIAYKCRNDEDRTMEFVSQASLSLTGYSSNEMVNNEKTPYGDLILPEDKKRVLNTIRQSIDNKEQFNLEYRINTKSGIIKWVREQGEGVFNEKGKLKNIQGFITSISERKEAELKLKAKEERLKQSFIQLAETTSRTLGVRDPYTQEHEQRVAELARTVGERMGLGEEKLMGLYLGGILHDIGKIAIPETILTKPGELNDVEWDIIRSHPEVGYNQILQDTDFPWPVAEMTLHHHERLDGSGYPDGLEGDELTTEVRILGAVDVVEAMSSRRPYRSPRTKKEVFEEIEGGKGEKYDSDVVNALLKMIDEGQIQFGER